VNKPLQHSSESDEIVKVGDKHSPKTGETVPNGSEGNQKVTPKELDVFITGLLKDSSEEIVWNRLEKLTKAYKKEAGVALLEQVLEQIKQMAKDGLSEKLMLPELEGKFHTNFKALLGALKPHFNANGRLTAGWKSRVLNTNSASGMGNGIETPKVPPQNQDKVVEKITQNDPKVVSSATQNPSPAPAIPHEASPTAPQVVSSAPQNGMQALSTTIQAPSNAPQLLTNHHQLPRKCPRLPHEIPTGATNHCRGTTKCHRSTRKVCSSCRKPHLL